VIVSRVIYVNLRVAPRGSGLCEVRAVNTIIPALFQRTGEASGRNDTTMLTHNTRECNASPPLAPPHLRTYSETRQTGRDTKKAKRLNVRHERITKNLIALHGRILRARDIITSALAIKVGSRRHGSRRIRHRSRLPRITDRRIRPVFGPVCRNESCARRISANGWLSRLARNSCGRNKFARVTIPRSTRCLFTQLRK
jgi:hypothetical protein